MTALLALTGSLLMSAALAIVVAALAQIPPVPVPSLGTRGAQRRKALAGSGLFAAVDPALRRLSGWIGELPLHGLRRRLDQRLTWAGQYLGFTADECIALSVLGGLSGAALGLVWLHFSHASPVWLVMTCLLGTFWFSLQLDMEVRRRRTEVDRQLPPTIDLLSLCVGAGSDLPAAVRFVLSDSTSGGTLHDELTHVLHELELGHTRQRALQGLAERVPTQAVLDFVQAVCQAEEKGNPLAEVLEIQARMLRMRRSVTAEEAAAKAGVRLIFPLVLLMICILLILFGSLLVKGMNGGL